MERPGKFLAITNRLNEIARPTLQSLAINRAARYSSGMDAIRAAAMNDDELKTEFAAALLKAPQTLEGHFQAALTLTSDTGKALLMASKWVHDPAVIAEQKRLVSSSNDGELDFIGTKAEFAREVLEAARNSWDGDTKHKFYKLYAEARGFIVKADTQVNVQVNQNRVMVVKDMGSDAEWEHKAQRQQRALIDVSASKH